MLAEREEQRAAMYGPLRGLQLKSYIQGIRNALYSERITEKKQKYNDSIVKYAALHLFDCVFMPA